MPKQILGSQAQPKSEVALNFKIDECQSYSVVYAILNYWKCQRPAVDVASSVAAAAGIRSS